MKKSLLTVITFALLVANTILTIMMFLNMQSEIKNANALISKVCEAIELDIASSDSNESTVPVDQTVSYDAVDSDNQLTVNLKMDEDGVAHFAVLTCTLTENMQSKAYETYGGTIGDYGRARFHPTPTMRSCRISRRSRTRSRTRSMRCSGPAISSYRLTSRA